MQKQGLRSQPFRKLRSELDICFEVRELAVGVLRIDAVDHSPAPRMAMRQHLKESLVR